MYMLVWLALLLGLSIISYAKYQDDKCNRTIIINPNWPTYLVIYTEIIDIQTKVNVLALPNDIIPSLTPSSSIYLFFDLSFFCFLATFRFRTFHLASLICLSAFCFLLVIFRSLLFRLATLFFLCTFSFLTFLATFWRSYNTRRSTRRSTRRNTRKSTRRSVPKIIILIRNDIIWYGHVFMCMFMICK